MLARAVTLALALVVVTALPVRAQNVPAHHHIAIAGTQSGYVQILPARRRSFLGLINDSTAVIYCTLDDIDAAANTGLRLNASGGSILLDGPVARGSLRCYSATDGSRVLITEGQ